MMLSPHEIAFLVIPRWPVEHHKTGVAVFLAESGGDTEAMHRSDDPASKNFGQWDHSLTQVSGRWNGDKLQANPDWRDPEVAVDLAKLVWLERKAQGKDPWTGWSVYNAPAPGVAPSYEKWLPDAAWGLLHPFPPPRPATSVHVAVLVEKLEAAMAEIGGLREQVDVLSSELAGVRKHFAA